MAKIGWGKKYIERVQGNNGNWAITEKKMFRKHELLFIPEFAVFNHIASRH